MARVLTVRRPGILAGLACLATAVLLGQSGYDLSVSVTSPGSATVNSPASFGVQVVNAGTASVTVTAVFQPAVVFNASGSTSTCNANSASGDPSTTVVCAGTSVTISVTPQAVGALNVVVGAISDQPDSNMLDNYARRLLRFRASRGISTATARSTFSGSTPVAASSPG